MLPTVKTTMMLALSVAFLAGCSSVSTTAQNAQPAISEANACAALENVFVNSADGFKSIRQNPSYQNKITLWDSSYQMIDGSCEIWQWSDKYSYVCSHALPNKEAAKAAYDQAAAKIKQCISKGAGQWQVDAKTLANGEGYVTQYRFNGNVRGTLKSVSNKGLLSDAWSVFLMVDSPTGTK